MAELSHEYVPIVELLAIDDAVSSGLEVATPENSARMQLRLMDEGRVPVAVTVPPVTLGAKNNISLGTLVAPGAVAVATTVHALDMLSARVVVVTALLELTVNRIAKTSKLPAVTLSNLGAQVLDVTSVVLVACTS